ncbi:sensor histidine kinase [Spirulina sp. CS-785/01]|uniref:sensor histidine kinase n=1 Tax=Spirulina sp. CS-785/01 TaxID=3021716 RepID=UPI003FA70F28
MFTETRRRLAIWYTLVTAILLLLFATGFYFYVRSTLIDRMDDTLKHVVEVVERSLQIEHYSPSQGGDRINITQSFRNNAETVEDDRIELEWFSPTGELRWTTFKHPPDIPLQVNGGGKTVHLKHVSGQYSQKDLILRQVTQRIGTDRQVLGYLRVSHPWFEVTKPIRQLIVDLAIGTSLMVVGVGAIGWLLSGLAIKPIQQSYQSLKQFTADASHELRNPLATIQTNVQMALSYPDQDSQFQQQQLQVIERLTQRLGRLVNDLLFLARSDSGIVQNNPQILPLDGLLIEAIEEQRSLAQQYQIGLSLRIHGDETFVVKGDWDQLARLFTNLISNAIEYTRYRFCEEETGEGVVEVELKPVKRDALHGGVQVKVKDTGIGIPETALPHIFDRFYRVDPARSRNDPCNEAKLEQPSPQQTGSGLGLAIAKAIVEQHHGQITVTSKPHQGTTFTVILPTVKDNG